jgi:hypothetical protein
LRVRYRYGVWFARIGIALVSGDQVIRARIEYRFAGNKCERRPTHGGGQDKPQYGAKPEKDQKRFHPQGLQLKMN